jgi:hypothetical protein
MNETTENTKNFINFYKSVKNNIKSLKKNTSNIEKILNKKIPNNQSVNDEALKYIEYLKYKLNKCYFNAKNTNDNFNIIFQGDPFKQLGVQKYIDENIINFSNKKKIDDINDKALKELIQNDENIKKLVQSYKNDNTVTAINNTIDDTVKYIKNFIEVRMVNLVDVLSFFCKNSNIYKINKTEDEMNYTTTQINDFLERCKLKKKNVFISPYKLNIETQVELSIDIIDARKQLHDLIFLCTCRRGKERRVYFKNIIDNNNTPINLVLITDNREIFIIVNSFIKNEGTIKNAIFSELCFSITDSYNIQKYEIEIFTNEKFKIRKNYLYYLADFNVVFSNNEPIYDSYVNFHTNKI